MVLFSYMFIIYHLTRYELIKYMHHILFYMLGVDEMC